jgi:hypothetical protein
MFWTLTILCCAIVAGADDKKSDKKADPADKPAAKEKVISNGTVVGKVIRVETAKHNLTVAVFVPTLVRYGRGVRVAQSTKNVDFQAADEVKVRSIKPPLDFDEKGKPRKYTSKELKELKGPDARLPGYQADFDSVKPDQIVQLTLAKRMPVGKPEQREKTKDKDDEKDMDKAPVTSEKPEVMMVVILVEPVK